MVVISKYLYRPKLPCRETPGWKAEERKGQDGKTYLHGFELKPKDSGVG